MRPDSIKIHRKSADLELIYGEIAFRLPAEYLRVHSPSAEVQGHGPGQEKLQVNKEDVAIDKLEPVGNYAVRITFDDGHDTGLYSWEHLYSLCKNYKENWHNYLERLKAAGHTRRKP